jgi:D-alanine-D-alanine ligase
VKITIIYNEPKHTEASDHWLSRSQVDVNLGEEFRDASEFGILEEMEAIAHAIESGGHEVSIFSVDDDIHRLIDLLDHDRPDAVFNLCEAVLGRAELEMPIAGIYELFDIPYTGAPALTLGIALNKAIAKSIFVANGISTPQHIVVYTGDAVPDHDLTFPLIVKPIAEDASIGIDNNSIVHDEEALRQRVAFIHNEFKEGALVEEYIDGREINVAVLGTTSGSFEALPVSEILFDTMPAGNPRIVSYEAKWVEESPLYKTTVPKCPADLDQATVTEAQVLALRAADLLGLRDYGRVDMRMRGSDNKLFVLEANPNPDISRDAGFIRSAITSGRTYEQTLVHIAECALARKS